MIDFFEMANSVTENYQFGFYDSEDGTYIFISDGIATRFLDMPAISFFAVLDNEEPENGKVKVYRITYAAKEPDAETDTEIYGLDWYPDAIGIVGHVKVADLKTV